MIKLFYRSLIELTNRPFLSKWLERLTRSKYSKVLIPSFTRVYKLNIEEMEKPISEYHTLHDLFTRKLKSTVRTVDTNPYSIISPVDGVLAEQGEITIDQTFVVKGKDYSIVEMLGEKEVATKYVEGKFVIIYLSPSHYHRIHTPISGKILSSWSLGTSSYPVNQWGILYGKSPFSKNFRVITEIQGDHTHMALVKVGAMFVNGIDLTHQGEHIEKGEEIAYFSFGSTVVLLFEKNTFTLSEEIKVGQEVKVGQPIGKITEDN
ncbi:phosphatidylserine decarboxylase [Bacillus mesophilus]|uniref:Phosphatidylserine decarboxylase proenzyme n=1 Tax=Bacillus mesophilus TaxID=1808955 RepID=A0A6M0Q9J1_9BACI|nr:phosphatidylserine decarboxylase [Bacillus mesophilus]MBM7660745.1 phosphatidylserine decarboxylase [Bacillus mesophilus]NEY71708.1 phosphatidylserine decarboxylase [Bacillus mesophilus]